MKVLICLTALVAVCIASSAYTYHGRYPGKCAIDGLYYKDAESFVYCSNGNSYVQKCAEGSRNSAYGKYSYGGSYGYRDFCDVNLVDAGYAAPAYAAPAGYAAPAYDAGYGYGRDLGYGYGRRGGYGYDRRGYGYPGY